ACGLAVLTRLSAAALTVTVSGGLVIVVPLITVGAVAVLVRWPAVTSAAVAWWLEGQLVEAAGARGPGRGREVWWGWGVGGGEWAVAGIADVCPCDVGVRAGRLDEAERGGVDGDGLGWTCDRGAVDHRLGGGGVGEVAGGDVGRCGLVAGGAAGGGGGGERAGARERGVVGVGCGGGRVGSGRYSRRLPLRCRRAGWPS